MTIYWYIYKCFCRITIQKIPNPVHINFKVRDLNVEFNIFIHGIDVIENIVNYAWNDALIIWIADNTLDYKFTGKIIYRKILRHEI